MKKTTITFEYVDDDGNEAEGELPAKYDVCLRCEGHGSHVNPNIDGHGITSEEWERDWDEESREAYFSGHYDVTCYTCAGKRVVLVLDHEACQATTKLQQLHNKYIEHQQKVAQWDHEDRMTRYYESGGRD
jgi:hypothetical protein